MSESAAVAAAVPASEPSKTTLAAVLARARPQIHDVVGRAHHVRIVLHHQDGVAQLAQLVEDADQPRRCPRRAGRWTARRARSRRPPGASPDRWPAGCAALRRRRAWPRAGRASGIRAPRRSGTSAAGGSRPGSCRRWRFLPARAASAVEERRASAMFMRTTSGRLSCRPRARRALPCAAARPCTPGNRVAAVAAQEHAHVQLVFLGFQTRRRIRAGRGNGVTGPCSCSARSGRRRARGSALPRRSA